MRDAGDHGDDDDKDFGYTLGAADYITKPADREHLGQVAEARPNAILLDLMVPEIDGFEFIVELRKREAWRHIPVVGEELTDEDRRRLNGSVERVCWRRGCSRGRYWWRGCGSWWRRPASLRRRCLP